MLRWRYDNKLIGSLNCKKKPVEIRKLWTSEGYFNWQIDDTFIFETKEPKHHGKKRTKTSRQSIVYSTLHRKLKTDEHSAKTGAWSHELGKYKEIPLNIWHPSCYTCFLFIAVIPGAVVVSL